MRAEDSPMTTIENTLKNVAERLEALRLVTSKGDAQHSASFEEITRQIGTLATKLPDGSDEAKLQIKRACDEAAKLAQSAPDPLLQVQEFACLSHLTWALAPLMRSA